MKIAFRVFLVIVFAFFSSLGNAEDGFIKTVGGSLKIMEMPGEFRGSNITLNGKPLLKEEVMSIEFVKKYTIDKMDVILVSLATGANGVCPIDYFFISIISKDSVSISPSISCHAEADLKTHQNHSKIIGVIPKLKGKGSDRYIFENGILTENGKVMRN